MRWTWVCVVASCCIACSGDDAAPRLDASDRDADASESDAAACAIEDAGVCVSVQQWGTDAGDVVYALVAGDAGAPIAIGRTAGELPGEHSTGDVDIAIESRARAGAERWALQLGSEGVDEAMAALLDEDGALLTVGLTTGLLGAERVGAEDAFIAKLDADHAIEWTTQWGTPDRDVAYAIARTPEGDFIVIGSTAGDLGRENPHADETFEDIFATKISRDGEVLWSAQWGAAEDDVGTAVTIARDGSIFVVGATAGAIDASVIHSGGYDAFVTKLDADGALLWNVQWGTTAYDSVRDLAVLDSGELLVVGGSEGALAGEGRGGAFLRMLDSDGSTRGAFRVAATTWDVAMHLAVDPDDGSIYVSGQTEGEVVPGAFAGYTDVFVTKRDAHGEELWSVQRGTSDYDDVYAMAVHDGAIYVGGYTLGAFEGFEPAGELDAFIVTVRE